MTNIFLTLAVACLLPHIHGLITLDQFKDSEICKKGYCHQFDLATKEVIYAPTYSYLISYYLANEDIDKQSERSENGKRSTMIDFILSKFFNLSEMVRIEKMIVQRSGLLSSIIQFLTSIVGLLSEVVG